MTALTGMGFSENRSKRALINTNHSGAEAAMEWLFSHMEDEGWFSLYLSLYGLLITHNRT